MSLTLEQLRIFERLDRGEITLDTPGVREAISGVTEDDLREHFEWVERQFKALREASLEAERLMREHDVEVASELERLGISNPFEEVARRIVRAHARGELTDDELRDFGVAEVDGEIVVAVSPLGMPKFTGWG